MITGEYWPAFGIMRIDADCSESLAKNVEVLSAYLHEEMHYIENFITLYGINRSIEIMSSLIKSIQDAHDGYYNTFRVSDEEDFDKTLLSVMKGDVDDVICPKIEDIDFLNIPKLFYEDQSKFNISEEVDTIELVYYERGKEKRYAFGGEAICESVAYLFEKYMCESDDYLNTFPYNACEMIYEYYWKEKCENTKALLFLGLVSLMNQFPGLTFIEYMIVLKTNNTFSLDAVRRIANLNVQFDNDELLAALDERIDILLPTIFDEISDDEIFKPYKEKVKYCNKWLKDLYRSSMKDRKMFFEGIFSFLKIDDNERGRNAFSVLFNKVFGRPIIFDINGKAFDKNDMRVFMFAPETLYHILVEKKKDCRLYPICRNYNPKCNSTCETDCTKYISEDMPCLWRYYLYLVGLGGLDLEALCY